jgi:hypothetical protein
MPKPKARTVGWAVDRRYLPATPVPALLPVVRFPQGWDLACRHPRADERPVLRSASGRWVMSKPVPIYGGSSRPCSPACALLPAPKRSHRVSGLAACPGRLYYTCYYTAPRRSAPVGRPGRRSGKPGSVTSAPRIRDQRIWPRAITCQTHGQCRRRQLVKLNDHNRAAVAQQSLGHRCRPRSRLRSPHRSTPSPAFSYLSLTRMTIPKNLPLIRALTSRLFPSNHQSRIGPTTGVLFNHATGDGRLGVGGSSLGKARRF